MLQMFYPDEIIASSYDIDYEHLYEEGVRGLIFDIDNTLVPHGAPADARAKELFSRLLKIGFSCCLLSNNKEPRVNTFNREIGVYQICDAHKPSKGCYLEAMKLMGTDLTSTVLIGDQLFTDVFGAKRIGMANILVRPLDPKEEIQIVFKRKLERIVLWFYERDQRKKAEEKKYN